MTLQDFSSNQPQQHAYGGLAAGSPGARWGLWGDQSGSFLKNSTPVGFAGNSEVGLAGIDYLADPKWLVGVTAGYTHAGFTLAPAPISRDANGAVVGPYAAYVLNSNMAVNATFSYTALDNTLSSPAPLPAGSYHSNRLTGATELDIFGNYQAIKLTGYGGYVYAWEGGTPGGIIGTGSANNVRFGAIRLGGEAAYDIGAFEPYIPVTFEYETTNPNDGTSRAALVLGGGFRYKWSETLTGEALVETTEIKTHTRDVLIGAKLRWSF